jgi:hypothetical protein
MAANVSSPSPVVGRLTPVLQRILQQQPIEKENPDPSLHNNLESLPSRARAPPIVAGLGMRPRHDVHIATDKNIN